MQLIPIYFPNINHPKQLMKPSIPLSLLAAALLTTAPASAFELHHSEGALSLNTTPEKLVSFDVGVLDSLAALGVPVSGVPKSSYEGHLARYQDVPVVGTLFEPDYAALKEIKPDLIIAGRRSLPAVPELRKIAPTVSFASAPNAFLKDFRESNLALGRAFGKEEQAKAALASIDAKVEALQQANKGKTAAVIFTMRGNVIPHAPGDRFGYAYELTGLESVLPAKDPKVAEAPRPEPGSPEAKAAAEERAKTVSGLASAEPDWLLVLDRGAINGGEHTAKATLEKHPQLGQTKAFKEGRVAYLDPNGWYIVGTGLNNVNTITTDLLEIMK